MGILHMKNVSRYRPYVCWAIAINQKQEKEKKEKNNNNKKNMKYKFFTLKLITVYKKLKLKMYVGPLLPKLQPRPRNMRYQMSQRVGVTSSGSSGAIDLRTY